MKETHYEEALWQLHAEIAQLLDGDDGSALVKRFLWLGVAYVDIGQTKAAERAFGRAVRWDRALQGAVDDAVGELKARLNEYAGSEVVEAFKAAAEAVRIEGTIHRRRSESKFRVGVMSGWTVQRFKQPLRDQPLSLNVYGLVSLRLLSEKLPPAWALLGSGGSPNLPPAGIVGLACRPNVIRPVTVFLGRRWGTQRERPRWTLGVGVDLRVL